MTVADSGVVENSMSYWVGNRVADGSKFGTDTRIGVLGLQPSFRFHSDGSNVSPETFGSCPVGRLIRRPVPVLVSLVV
ncbi:MAG: hypothetical protein ACOYOQ_02595 [Microthrixaceae bacterium]